MAEKVLKEIIIQNKLKSGFNEIQKLIKEEDTLDGVNVIVSQEVQTIHHEFFGLLLILLKQKKRSNVDFIINIRYTKSNDVKAQNRLPRLLVGYQYYISYSNNNIQTNKLFEISNQNGRLETTPFYWSRLFPIIEFNNDSFQLLFTKCLTDRQQTQTSAFKKNDVLAEYNQWVKSDYFRTEKADNAQNLIEYLEKDAVSSAGYIKKMFRNVSIQYNLDLFSNFFDECITSEQSEVYSQLSVAKSGKLEPIKIKVKRKLKQLKNRPFLEAYITLLCWSVFYEKKKDEKSFGEFILKVELLSNSIYKIVYEGLKNAVQHSTEKFGMLIMRKSASYTDEEVTQFYLSIMDQSEKNILQTLKENTENLIGQITNDDAKKVIKDDLDRLKSNEIQLKDLFSTANSVLIHQKVRSIAHYGIPIMVRNIKKLTAARFQIDSCLENPVASTYATSLTDEFDELSRTEYTIGTKLSLSTVVDGRLNDISMPRGRQESESEKNPDFDVLGMNYFMRVHALKSQVVPIQDFNDTDHKIGILAVKEEDDPSDQFRNIWQEIESNDTCNNIIVYPINKEKLEGLREIIGMEDMNEWKGEVKVLFYAHDSTGSMFALGIDFGSGPQTAEWNKIARKTNNILEIIENQFMVTHEEDKVSCESIFVQEGYQLPFELILPDENEVSYAQYCLIKRLKKSITQ